MFTNEPIPPQVLQHMTISKPLIPVHSNIDGKAYKNEAEIKKYLPRQICAPVKWEQILHILYDRSAKINYPNTYECGPGKSLKTILKMVNQKAMENMINIEA